ncbi:MAG: type IV pilus assembly protein PilM [Pseudomonadota bacterium]
MFGNKQVVGLDLGSSSIKMAEENATGKSFKLVNFGMSPIPEGLVDGGEIIDPAALSQIILALHKELGIKTKTICTGMFGGAVIVKKISMPRIDPKLVSEQIQWEAEQYIPFDLSEVNLDYHLIQGGAVASETMDILLVAAKHDYIIRYFEAIESAGLKCSIIDVNGFALANSFEINYGLRSGETVAIINLGSGVSNLVVIENGNVVFCRDIPVGGSVYNMEISRDLGVSTQEAEELKIGYSQTKQSPAELANIISSTNEMICEEIKDSFRFYEQSKSGSQVSSIFLSGGSIKIPHLVESISTATGLNCQILNPLQKVTYNKKAFSDQFIDEILPFLPGVIGLAARKMGDS